MREKRIEISEETKAILRRAVIEGNSLKMVEKLDRKTYVKVNDVLFAAGGVWSRKAKAHLFDGDPREILGIGIENGFITKDYVIDNKKTFGQFFTPMFLAAQMVNMAEIEPGQTVLEPSAGEGRILTMLLNQYTAKQVTESRDLDITAVEIDFDLAWKLEQDFPGVAVWATDFLSIATDGIGPFDRVLMNPPFTNGEDIKHIFHARRMLAEGGILIAVCANGPRQREALQPIAYDYQELPERTFEDEGTDVNTALVTIKGLGTHNGCFKNRG